jgi:hypothetical protein
MKEILPGMKLVPIIKDGDTVASVSHSGCPTGNARFACPMSIETISRALRT